MVSKKRDFLHMAEACYENARKLQLDSLALKKRKSPGHAYSLLILSVEEAVKAIVYRLAADGIMKIIGEEEPEEPFSIRQKDLLNHSMKHEILGGIIVSSIMYSPFSTAFDDIQCGNIKVNEAKRRIVKSIANHQALLMDLKDLNSQISRWIRRFTDCLSVLNHEKNLGFYVSYEDSKIIRPNEVPAKRYHYWLEFSKDWLSLTDEIVRSGIGEEQILVIKQSQRAIIRRVKRIEKKMTTKETGGGSVAKKQTGPTRTRNVSTS